MEQTEELNIFACLAKAKEDPEVEINWCSFTEWYTFEDFSKYDKPHDIHGLENFPGPFYTRKRQSIVDKIVTDVALLFPSVVTAGSPRLKEILNGYHITEKSTKPRIEFDLNEAELRTHEAILRNGSGKSDTTTECDIPEPKQSKLDEAVKEIHRWFISADDKDLKHLLSKYITEPTGGIDECVESVCRFRNIPTDRNDTHLVIERIITKHWPRQVDHDFDKIADIAYDYVSGYLVGKKCTIESAKRMLSETIKSEYGG